MSGHPKTRTALACALLVAAAQAPRAAAGADDDWPCFRGPEQDGISRETGILKRWPRGGLETVWRIELGAGFSSFAAVGERLYTMAERSGGQEALCLDAKSGKVLWSHPLEGAFMERQGGDGPRATPAVKDGRVFVLGAKGTLAALDAREGKPVWSKNVLADFNAKNITWGLSASPLLDDDRVVVVVGGKEGPVVAFSQESGEVAWRSGSDGHGDLAGYSTPLSIVHGGRRQIVVLLGRSVASFDAGTGQLLWSHPWRTSYDVNAAAPIHQEGRLFISSGYNEGCALLELPAGDGGKPREVWRSKVLRNKFSSCVLKDGHLYGFDENRLKCVEFLTGRERWKVSGLGHGTLLLADGHLIVLSDSGDLALAPATPAGYRESARMEGVLKGGVAWTAPVLHRGVLYLRNQKQAVALRMKP